MSGNGSGDWHEVRNFFVARKRTPRTLIVEQGCDGVGLFKILGSVGIIDVAQTLRRMGIDHPHAIVYAANHSRATMDLVLDCVLSGEDPAFVALDDWMPRDSDKREVIELIQLATPKLSIVEIGEVYGWAAREIRNQR
ncbi:MAG: hypothetical protein M3N13_09225 [Candidatus Eremiobacteraeota bacterium]|nr:hypothetical protein [Candidatus Eremiobacteraeota bacterium]